MNTKARILKLLGYGQLNQKGLAKKLNLTEATISYHIKGLMKEGKIQGKRTTSRFLNLKGNPSMSDKEMIQTLEKPRQYKHLTSEERRKLKLEVLKHYCKDTIVACKCCKEDNLRFLTLDHINGGGAEHRKQLGGMKIYEWIVKNDYPQIFQILCMNCNWAKGQYGTCPHLTLNPPPSEIRSKSLSKSRIVKEALASSPTSKLRLHRIYRSYPLLGKLGELGGDIIKLNNNEQRLMEFENLTLRITTKHIIVEGIQLVAEIGVLAPQLLIWAEQLSDGILARAMEKFSICADLGKGETRLVEVALTEYDVAKKSREKGIVPFYWNPITGIVEVWGDTSHNIGELETNRIPHAERLRQLTKDIVEARWSTQDQIKINAQQIEFFTKHNALIDEIRVGLRDMRIARHTAPEGDKILYRKSYTMRKKAKVGEDPRQGRLM